MGTGSPGRMRPLRIAYLLPDLESGGTERHVLHLAQRVNPARFALSLVTIAGGGSLHEAFAESARFRRRVATGNILRHPDRPLLPQGVP